MRPTVFIVDDDASFLSAAARLLRASGFAVRPFNLALEFLAQLDPETPGCALVDLQIIDNTTVNVNANIEVIDDNAISLHIITQSSLTAPRPFRLPLPRTIVVKVSFKKASTR